MYYCLYIVIYCYVCLLQRAGNFLDIRQRMEVNCSFPAILVACLAPCPSMKHKPCFACAVLENFLTTNALLSNNETTSSANTVKLVFQCAPLRFETSVQTTAYLWCVSYKGQEPQYNLRSQSNKVNRQVLQSSRRRSRGV